jgi:hypothetical protein
MTRLSKQQLMGEMSYPVAAAVKNACPHAATKSIVLIQKRELARAVEQYPI